MVASAAVRRTAWITHSTFSVKNAGWPSLGEQAQLGQLDRTPVEASEDELRARGDEDGGDVGAVINKNATGLSPLNNSAT